LTLLLNDDLTWIRRLAKEHHRKLFAKGQSILCCLQYTVSNAAGNDREDAPALCWFLILPATGHNDIVGNRRQCQCGATGWLAINRKLLALTQILHDDDPPESGIRCVGTKIYPLVPSSKP
jgi:hypothetical protein